MLPPRPVDIDLAEKSRPDRVLLSTYVPLQERIHRLMGIVAFNSKGA